VAIRVPGRPDRTDHAVRSGAAGQAIRQAELDASQNKVTKPPARQPAATRRFPYVAKARVEVQLPLGSSAEQEEQTASRRTCYGLWS
jgi:hypothetical protein